MQNFLSLRYMLRVLLAVSANFPDNPRSYVSWSYTTLLQIFLSELYYIGEKLEKSESYMSPTTYTVFTELCIAKYMYLSYYCNDNFRLVI